MYLVINIKIFDFYANAEFAINTCTKNKQKKIMESEHDQLLYIISIV